MYIPPFSAVNKALIILLHWTFLSRYVHQMKSNYVLVFTTALFVNATVHLATSTHGL
ncbi:hypothetical protein J3F84DRAFT_187768 [Trichoderma pleuroticola]